MPSVPITLRQVRKGEWALFAPKGHQIAGPIRGSQYAVVEWAKRFISSWLDWTLTLEKQDEETSGVSTEVV